MDWIGRESPVGRIAVYPWERGSNRRGAAYRTVLASSSIGAPDSTAAGRTSPSSLPSNTRFGTGVKVLLREVNVSVAAIMRDLSFLPVFSSLLLSSLLSALPPSILSRSTVSRRTGLTRWPYRCGHHSPGRWVVEKTVEELRTSWPLPSLSRSSRIGDLRGRPRPCCRSAAAALLSWRMS